MNTFAAAAAPTMLDGAFDASTTMGPRTHDAHTHIHDFPWSSPPEDTSYDHAMREYSLLFACLALLPNVIISAVFGLDMHWKAILAVIRCVVQLTLLGYIFGFL